MAYEEKNICKKCESKIKKPERKLGSTEKNVLSDIGNNIHEMEKDCSLHPQRFKTEPNLYQKDFCGSFETHISEGENSSSSESVELINNEGNIIKKEKRFSMKHTKEDTETVSTLNLNIPNFKQKVIEQIKKLTNSIECSIKQKKIILLKSETILNKHISRAKRNEITIRKNSNPYTQAAAIIYAVLKSNNKMPKISIENLAKKAGVSKSPIGKQYQYFKNLAPKLDFDFNNAQLGETRRILSIYFFNQLINTRSDLSELISHLREIDISRLVLRLGEIIIDANKLKFLDSFTSIEALRRLKLTLEERNLLGKLKEKIEILRDMKTNFTDIFTKYFSDLVNLIKLMIISNKSHKIIDADFSAQDFSRFLIDKGINMYTNENTLAKTIIDIFIFLKKKYPDYFPTRVKTGEGWASRADNTGHIRKRVVGSRIKLYVMKHIYKGKYYNCANGIAICPECLNEGFTVNTSLPRIRSKEFHHEDMRLEGYSVNELYKLFVNDRGNPNFLRDLIKKISYKEAKELAFFGTKVLHPLCLDINEKGDISSEVRFFNEPESEEFTTISKEIVQGDRVIKAITSIEKLSMVTIEGDTMIPLSGTASKLFSLLGENNINIVFISQSSSENNITFGIEYDDSMKVSFLLRNSDYFGEEWFKIKIDHEISLVAVIGAGILHTPGIAGKVFTSLGNNQINIKAIAQGSSELNFTAIIDRENCKKAINVLYNAFINRK